MAAMIGFGPPSRTPCSSGKVAPFGGLPNSAISAPAMKVRPAQITTMALTSGSAAALATPSRSPLRTSAESALTGGELIVTAAISPARDRSVTEFTAVIAHPLRLPACAHQLYVQRAGPGITLRKTP